MTAPLPHTASPEKRQRFAERLKLLADPEQAKQLAGEIQTMLADGQNDSLRSRLSALYPPDIADVLAFLDDAQDRAVFRLLSDEEAAEVLDEVDDCTRETLVQRETPERLAHIVAQLPSDEATDMIEALKPEQVEPVLTRLDPTRAQQIRQLLAYPKESAGGIMSLGFIAVRDTATMGRCITRLQGELAG